MRTRRCKYYIVFAPKYRRQMIYGKYKKSIGEIIRELCERSRQPKNNNTKYIFSTAYDSVGSTLIRTMQRDISTTANGVISYKSTMIKALQRKYGIPKDGYIYYPSTLTRKTQKRLNKGIF